MLSVAGKKRLPTISWATPCKGNERPPESDWTRARKTERHSRSLQLRDSDRSAANNGRQVTSSPAERGPASWSRPGTATGRARQRTRPRDPSGGTEPRRRFDAAYPLRLQPVLRSKRCTYHLLRADRRHPDRPNPARRNGCDIFQPIAAERKQHRLPPNRRRSVREFAPPARSKRSEGIFVAAAASWNPLRRVS
jgi:hypothetical protein